MSLEMGITLGIFFAAIILFVTEWLRVDVVALGVVVALLLTGVISTNEALAGFSNPVVLTVAALFIVGGAVLQTGLAGLIGERILRIAGKSETRLILLIMLVAALISGVMSDTGTVAVLLPAIISLARAANLSPSKLLIPLSYGALLGGATTLIGTPPNILVSNLLRAEAEQGFHFFSYTPVGLMMLVVGIVFMVTIGRRILPDYRAKQDLRDQVRRPDEIIDAYRLPDNLYHLRVTPESRLEGQSVAEARLRSDFGLTVVDILRPPRPQNLVSLGGRRLVLQGDSLESVRPSADRILQTGDILVVQGSEADVKHAIAFWNLGLQPARPEDRTSLINQEAGIAEVLLPPGSRLVGSTLVDVRFGSVYKLTVLAITRPGTEHLLNLKDVVLQMGDILLVQGFWDDILALRKQQRDFVVLGQPETMLDAPSRRKAPIATLVLLAMLVALISGVTNVATASMTAALAMVLTGCLTMDDAYNAIDWKSIVLIAGMLPMSTALEAVGVVNQVALGLTDALGGLGPLVILAGLFLITSLFTQVISNTATAVLIAPIALATAREMNVEPQAFLMAVAIAASMAFASPVASPVNTLVMGAGSYRFSDYIKIGVPMIFLMLIVACIGLPLMFPF